MQNKPTLIDTHSHIYADQFVSDIDQVILRAKENGVRKILLPNIDDESVDALHKLSEAYPDYCIPMMGLHPTSVDQNWEAKLDFIKSQIENNKGRYIAIGEIGIDLYWDKTFFKEQQQAFEQQLEWSLFYDLPVAIHTREAISEAIESILKVGKNKLRGVFHSFTGTSEELEEILKLDNFCIGINGVVTYKNSNLRAVLQNTDLSKIIIETDAPYLTPVPYRGKRNEPSYTTYILDELCKIYSVSPDEAGEITTQNAITLFDLK